MLATAINVEQIDEVFPITIQRLQIRRNLFAGGELLVVRINLVLHPAQILDRLALAGIERLDYSFALSVTQLAGAFLFSALDQAAIKWSCRYHGKIKHLASQAGDQRLPLPPVPAPHAQPTPP